MADYITRIRTISGDKQIDYNALANLPDFSFVEEMRAQIDELNIAITDTQDTVNSVSEATTAAQESADGAMLAAEEAMNLANDVNMNSEKVSNKVMYLSDTVTDDQYPSARAVYDAVQTLGGSVDSIDCANTIFNYIKIIDSVTGSLYYLQMRDGVLVSSKSFDSFEVTGVPEKYYVGTEPDLSNLVVTATYSDGSSSVVNNYTVDVSEPVDGAVVLTVNYLGGSKVYNVPCINFTSFEVSGMPEHCLAGEPINLNNLVVMATYEDGTVARMTKYTVTQSPVDDETIMVTITCAGMSNSYNVAVFRRFDQNTLSNLFIDFVYTDNGDGTYTIIDWKGTLNGQPSTEIVVPDSRQIIVNTNWE